MKNNGVAKYVALATLGFVMLGTGLVFAISLPDAQGIMRTLPYICIGIGTGIFGGNLGSAIKNQLLKRDPYMAKQIQIDIKDERNITISDKAKAKAYDLMLMAYGALILAFALMQVDMYVIITFVAAYLLVVLMMVFYITKYQKEM